MASNVLKMNKNLEVGNQLPQLQFILSKNLSSGVAYQRVIDHQKVQKIVKEFNPHKLGIIKVSYRDGQYHVYDGQHRLMALKIINNNKDCMIPCEIHYGLTYEDEARLFAEQYDGATKVDIIYQMGALYEAKDEEVITLKEIVESAGLELSFSKAKGNNRIIAVSQVRKMYKELYKDGLYESLNLIKQTWDGVSSSLDKHILGGMRVFYKIYRPEVNERIFIKNLSKIQPMMIKRIGDSDISARGDLKYAKVILDYYNKGQTVKTRLDYKFKG
jgi:hypothetical protein